MLAIDTLKFANKLQEAGMERKQAEAQAEVISTTLNEAVSEMLATKSDIKDLEKATKLNIEGVRNELKSEIEGVRNELKSEIEGVRNELKIMKYQIYILTAIAIIPALKSLGLF